MNTIFDLDRIAPPPPPSALSKEERRLRLAIDKALKSRQPQQDTVKLIAGADQSLLKTMSDNTRMRLLVGLRPANDGDTPTKPVIEARIRIYAALDFGHKYRDANRELGQRIGRHFIAEQGGRNLVDRWAAADQDERLNIGIEMLHAFGHESGYAPPSKIDAQYMPPTPEGRIRQAQYTPNDDTLMFNSHPDAGWDDAIEMAAVTGHEATHKMQSTMAANLMREQRPDLFDEATPDKPLFASDAERQQAWYFFDNLRFGYITGQDSPIGYKNQPIEAQAMMVEQSLKECLNRNLVLGADQGLILGAGADDLAALGVDLDKLRNDGAAKGSAPEEALRRRLTG